MLSRVHAFYGGGVFLSGNLSLCGRERNACVQSAVTRNSSLKQNKLKWELPGQKKPLNNTLWNNMS